MDFIEQWAHVSPDGGSGALEALYVLVAAAVAATAVVRQAFKIIEPKGDR